MDREDRRRYFVVGSVILEIVTPVFRKKIESDYQNKGIGSFKDFLDHPPILHILFHLRHKNTCCCQDRANCICNRVLPLNYSHWNLLYSQNPSACGRLCHCKFVAKPVHVDDLDIALASLILMNCCTLTSNEIHLIEDLRILKNNYLSHNENGGITLLEYNTLWPELTKLVLQLDPGRKDDMERIKFRPLDETHCLYYVANLLDLHKKLNEINDKIDAQNAENTTKVNTISEEQLAPALPPRRGGKRQSQPPPEPEEYDVYEDPDDPAQPPARRKISRTVPPPPPQDHPQDVYEDLDDPPQPPAVRQPSGPVSPPPSQDNPQVIAQEQTSQNLISNPVQHLENHMNLQATSTATSISNTGITTSGDNVTNRNINIVNHTGEPSPTGSMSCPVRCIFGGSIYGGTFNIAIHEYRSEQEPSNTGN